MDTTPDRRELCVAIGGYGAIGEAVARRLDAGIEGLKLVGVAARDAVKAESRVAKLKRPVPVVRVDKLAELADIVVECASAAAFLDIARPALAAGRIFMPLSVGALLSNLDLVDLARETGGRIVVPTGAIVGLDAVRAAAEGTISSARIITRKPPAGLVGAPYLVEHGIVFDDLKAPLKVFDGSAREGAKGFPANVNVAAALSLAGIGPDRTRLEVWADPGVTRNTHRIEIESDSARLSMQIENIPSPDNPRTGRITALSVVAALRGLVAPLKVGT